MLVAVLGIGAMAGIQAAASTLTPLDTFYPPNLNDTSYISNSSLGLYGGIYSAPAEEVSSGSSYGVYDYCSMPHPRVQEYQLPAPVRDGKVKGKIVYLEYVQRHQRRTPYNILPGGENQPYDCDNILPYLYGAPQHGSAPIPVYAQTYIDSSNPFINGYINSTCQFPQLTLGGLLDGFQHGRDLWAVYGDKLGLLPRQPDDRVWFRSSSSPLTQQSAGGVLRGIWPNYQGSLPLQQQTSAVDTVNEGYSCDARNTVLSAIKSTNAWNQHLAVTADLRSALGSMLGATDSSWQSTFDHFSDNFQARLCNGYELPCSFTHSSNCATNDQADEVFRAGDWEWNYYWRTNPNVTKYIQLVQGLFIGEVVKRFEAVQQGKSSVVYSHVFVHDGDIGPILGALGITALRWPAMGSNVAFEIWKTNDHINPYYARVLYSGQPVETIRGTLDWLPLSQLISILKVYVPDDIVGLCGS